MHKRFLIALIFLPLISCIDNSAFEPQTQTLSDKRNSFTTTLARKESSGIPLAQPPKGTFDVVTYTSPAGELAAYLTPDPGDGNKHPAIIWITGGECNTIGDVWSPASPENDQTAAAYREAGIVMMFPSLRGGNTNPGVIEGFYGEVDDIIAAADFLAKQPFVDPDRIYLGGHSTGGTMVLLVAECSDRFRAVFSFGPVEDVRGYGPDFLPVSIWDAEETAIRSPGPWLGSINSLVFVFEGTVDGNVDSLRTMQEMTTSKNIHFFEVQGEDHFSVLAPINQLISQKILQDTGEKCDLSFTQAELMR